MSNTEVVEQKTRAPAPAIAPPRLPYHPAIEERFGVNITEWRALVDAVFPLAKDPSSVILALSYCKARKLDPFKRPVHIVPMWNAQLKRMVETVWPGIGELRTTAFRTGQYAGRDEAKYGPTKTEKIGSAVVTYPEWCQVTVYRLLNGERMPFPGPRVWWLETYATAGKDDPSPNSMWRRRSFGQIDKCAEAAALRAAFPEEVGNEYSAEEMEGKVLEGAVSPTGEVTIAKTKALDERLDQLADGAAIDHDPDTGEVIEEENTGTETAGPDPAASQAAADGQSTSEATGEAAAGEEARGEPRSAAAEPHLFGGRSLAYRFGYEAAGQGVPRERPPGDLGPDEAEEWQSGWDAAKGAVSAQGRGKKK
jgi:phage recombination protein Bet